MKTKKNAGLVMSIEPDDAPNLTDAMLEKAETFNGDHFIGRGRGRPKSDATKEQISVRLDADVLAKLRETGPGWQSRINAVLRDALGLNDRALVSNFRRKAARA